MASQRPAARARKAPAHFKQYLMNDEDTWWSDSGSDDEKSSWFVKLNNIQLK